MAKADMTIQINVSAPGLEVAIKALTDAIVQKNGEVVIPEGTAMKITDVQAAPVAEAQPEQPQPQAIEQPAPAVAPAPVAEQPAPVATAEPIPTPVAADPMPAPVAQEIPANNATQVAPAPAPVPVAPAPAPVPQAKAVTLDDICNAGAKLVEQGMMNQVIALLGKYGVQAVNQIKPEQYEAFAGELRKLGAQI